MRSPTFSTQLTLGGETKYLKTTLEVIKLLMISNDKIAASC